MSDKRQLGNYKYVDYNHILLTNKPTYLILRLEIPILKTSRCYLNGT